MSVRSALSLRSDAELSDNRTVARSDVKLHVQMWRVCTHVVARIGTKIPLFRSHDQQHPMSVIHLYHVTNNIQSAKSNVLNFDSVYSKMTKKQHHFVFRE